MAFIIKTIIAVMIILAASELSKRNVTWAAILLAMPIVLFTSFTIIWEESRNIKLISDLTYETLIFILLVIPFLFLFSLMLKANISFYISMTISSIGITIVTLLAHKFFS
jgi:hypothetical protein